MSWRLFIGAAMVVGTLLITAGVPLTSILPGVAIAAWFSRARSNHAQSPQ